MMSLVQVIWLGLSAGIFAIWACTLCALLPALRRRASGTAMLTMTTACADLMRAQILGRLAALTVALLMLIGLDLLIWPP
ncbi:hypothetical protein ACEWPM_008245 [Roseovarius sp. S4756]|uniref:hypothetical protein n=1 Tax=Roseovarius maritimus TaxID=3342637 RepID=UPI003728E45F